MTAIVADLALVFALDASASVTIEEFGAMASGIASGLRDPAIRAGLVGGAHGATVAAVVIWSGAAEQQTMIAWTRLSSDAEADAFADAVENMPRIVRAGATAIGEALALCVRLLAAAPASARQVVNVVGDGRSNDGREPAGVRDVLVAAGVAINGLCVLHEEPDLLAYYEANVIGGPGAFAVQCQDFAGFADALRRKLAQEVIV